MKILKYIQLFALCVVVPALASCDDDDDNVAAYVPRTAVGTELVAAGVSLGFTPTLRLSWLWA